MDTKVFFALVVLKLFMYFNVVQCSIGMDDSRIMNGRNAFKGTVIS